MKFCECLNEYIHELNCSNKELSEASGLSSAVISRYRSGEREPGIDSEQFHMLVVGLEHIATAKSNHIFLQKDIEGNLKKY